jgi:hypothetical protein
MSDHAASGSQNSCAMAHLPIGRTQSGRQNANMSNGLYGFPT